MLRYDDELEYKTLTGGIISMAIIITTIYGFANMIMDTLNLSSITTSIDIVKSSDPTPSSFSTAPGSNFMFATEIWQVDTTGSKRYFDLQFHQQVKSGLTIQDEQILPLEICTRDHWASFPSVLEKFERIDISNWWCPPLGITYDIYGKYSSEKYTQYWVSASVCKNETEPSRPCAPQIEIDELFSNFTSNFYFTLYYVNPIINSDHKEYMSYYLEDQNYLIFGDKVGAEVYTYFTDYTIETDVSIWPFSDIVTDTGVLVEGVSPNYPFQAQADGTYARIYMSKSANSITYTRAVQKISSVFSFIGGMIEIALSVFRPDENSNPSLRSITTNFFTFLKYYFFELTRKIGLTFDWPQEEYISACQEEISKQLSVQSLIKRIIFLEYCLTYTLEDYQLGGLQIETPTSPHQIRDVREKCSYIFKHSAAKEKELKSRPRLGEEEEEEEGESGAEFNGQSEISPSPLGPSKSKLEREMIVVEEMSDLSSEASVSVSINANLQRKRKNAIFNDCSKNEKIREQLQILCENAEAGNPISRKIWSLLSHNTKKLIKGPDANDSDDKLKEKKIVKKEKRFSNFRPA